MLHAFAAELQRRGPGAVRPGAEVRRRAPTGRAADVHPHHDDQAEPEGLLQIHPVSLFACNVKLSIINDIPPFF